ncbi:MULTISPECIES: S8 family serine peptidase [Bacillaceae]|uniref:S8 family serine peptidase n=1 Tax=Evansella alkalicola TaxID=745819 RepID=A0ABS6JV47_9BACI|nr:MULTISPECIES: S8 family serine peptidase [Bacillaceae]MBU9722421.1 S8 family serine peptidase [Bacillus alkalicola]
MKKLLTLSILTLAMLVGFFSVNAFADNEVQKEEHKYIEGQLIVSVEMDGKENSLKGQLNSTTELLQDNAELKKKGFVVADSLLEEKTSDSQSVFSDSFVEKAAKKTGFVYLMEYSTAEYDSIKTAKKELEETLNELGLKVRYVSENFVVELLETEAVAEADENKIAPLMHRNQEWHYGMINAPDAWGITTGSSNVRMAVLDTGIDSSHPSLRNLVDTSLGRSYVGGNPEDRQGHGTHVAGTIASYGNVSGVMQNASLISVKVLGDDGSGSTYGIQQGVLYAASINADVINMSLGGGGYSQGFSDAIDTAVANGTVVIAASGNDGRASISYPAAYEGAIAVGSVTSSGSRSNFSNYGNGLELMAPGSSIYSTYPNGQYRTLSGTSMAAPHAAGVAGLVRAVDPSLSVSEVRGILADTAQYAGGSHQYGNGIVDAYAAVQAAGGSGGAPAPSETNTSVSTNGSVFERGDDVTMTASVTDGSGNGLQGATVNFTITRPNGSTVTNTATTNSSGNATWTIGSNSQTALGTYEVTAETTLSGYESSSDTTSFSFSNQAQTQQTVTDVSTNSNYYVRGQNVTVSAEVRDQDGAALSNATVSFTITRPNGSTVTNTGTTNSAGVATWTVSTSGATATGTYQVTAETSLTNYEGSSDSTSFYVY